MRVLIDTNVLISAALFPKSIPYRAYVKAVTTPCRGVICEQNADELRRIFNRKWPDKTGALETFLALAMSTLTIVPIPEQEITEEAKVRDVKDRPILRAAVCCRADVLLTGDKDFLESGIHKPRILSPSQFLEKTLKSE